MFKCLSIYKRTDDIVEIQEGRPTQYESDACSPYNMDETVLPFTTLLSGSSPDYLLVDLSFTMFQMVSQVPYFSR